MRIEEEEDGVEVNQEDPQQPQQITVRRAMDAFHILGKNCSMINLDLLFRKKIKKFKINQ